MHTALQSVSTLQTPSHSPSVGPALSEVRHKGVITRRVIHHDFVIGLQPQTPKSCSLGTRSCWLWGTTRGGGGGKHWRGVTRPLPRPGPRCGLGDNASPGSLCALNLPFSPTPGLTQTTPPTQSTMCSVSSRLRGEPGPRMCIWKAKISLGLGWGWRGLT